MRILLTTVAFAVAAFACGGHAKPASTQATAPSPATAEAWTPTSFTVKVSGTGKPVIFIPGLTCDGSVWDETLGHLGGKVEAHVLSLAGFGGTPPIDQPLLPTVHDELIQYIEHNHLDHPILVGHSLGGFMAFWVAETASDRLGGIVSVDGAPFIGALFDPKATVDTVREQAKQMGDMMAKMTATEFETGIAQFLGNMVTGEDDRQRIDAVAGKSDPRTTGAAMEFLFTTDLRPDLAAIKVPVLLIAADTHGQVPADQIEATWKAQVAPIPDHGLVMIANARHFLMFDQRDAFYAALDRFLAT